MHPLPNTAVGIGLRHCHYRDFQAGRPDTAWVEVHSENYFGAGGRDLHVLETVRRDYPVSLHGVGLALGSAAELARAHLRKLNNLVGRIEPALVSEHLCWGGYQDAGASRHWNDLLPLPYTDEALALMAARVDEVQEALGRRILVENISSYVEFSDSRLGELEFVNALAKRTGCGVLLDLNNLHVNAVNHGRDAYAELRALDPRHVGEIHLAGHFSGEDGLIDDHGSRVTAAVWQLYAHYVERNGAAPTLIEWDTAIPALDVLLDEARKARAVAETNEAAHA